MLGKSKAKYIQSLGQKKQRDQEGLFIAEGPKIVAELLRLVPQSVMGVYAVKEWLNENEFAGKTEIIEVTDIELEKISQLKTPHQVLAVIKKFETIEKVDTKGRVSLVLDTIQDPGNLGTIIRTADWFGLQQIICSNDCADIYNPKVVQATMGSIARIKVFYTDLTSWLRQQKEIPVYATMLEGRDVTQMQPIKEGLIIIGNESKGIHEEIAALATERITIPKRGNAESLNAAVAVGIVLAGIAISR